MKENFLNNNQNISSLNLPNLTTDNKSFIIPDKIEGDLKLPNLEEITKVNEILASVGISTKDFINGNLSLENIRLGIEVLKSVGINPEHYMINNIDLDVEELGDIKKTR